MTRGPQSLRSERGASAVELALLLPVLLILIGGIIDFGRAFSAQASITSAAREGARMAALGLSSSVQPRVTSAASPYAATATVTYAPPATPLCTVPALSTARTRQRISPLIIGVQLACQCVHS